MRVLATLAVLRLFLSPGAISSCDVVEPLPSRVILLANATPPDAVPVNFDLVDYRADERDRPARRSDTSPHSIFGIKHHIGLAAGYDSGVVHGALGFYLTVAEWGRWNFGVPSPELGFGRYRAYDAKRNRSITKDESTLFISLASVHYRVGFARALGVNCYLNLEQIFDPRLNMAGSQFGLSFSTK